MIVRQCQGDLAFFFLCEPPTKAGEPFAWLRREQAGGGSSIELETKSWAKKQI
jgi:hypothetical protein